MTVVQPISPFDAVTQERVVNNFCITVATVNGSGSQTSNFTIMRALLKMGVPVSGKNMFPSNIQGLPTWFTIRASRDLYMARCENQEIVVAMNPDTFQKDLDSLQPGGVFFYADHIKNPIHRQDIILYPMPIQKITRESSAPPNLRDYIANMVYVGVVAQILGIHLDKIHQALDFHFKGKEKAVEMNFNVVQAAADWAAQNLEKRDPYVIEAMKLPGEYIMTDGNTAAALGALYGGVHFAAWYPITPASSLAESLLEYAPILRKDPETGKNTLAVIQAEDELAAAGMVVGAGWSGLRAMTSTSGPGLSLMAEYVGLAYFAEVPIVIWDIQRVGPATGLPTRTAQGDLTFVNFMSHGDTQHIMLIPGSIAECFEYGWRSFDLAERLQTPIFVMSDLDFGMNNWMTPPFEYPETPMDRGKLLWEGDLDRMNGEWSRYLDKDGDGIPYRTVPGNRHPRAAYFTRGTGHDETARYTEDPVIWERMLDRVGRKYETAKGLVPPPVIDEDGAKIGLIAFGSTDPAIQEARDRLAEQGMKTDYMRLRAVPFTPAVADFIRRHDRNYVVELNRDGQMHQLLRLEVQGCATELISLAHIDGLPLSAQWVVNALLAEEEIA
jgi:2-oxoglutarate ferredoxin oxidoreductase subunit alpha